MVFSSGVYSEPVHIKIRCLEEKRKRGKKLSLKKEQTLKRRI